MPGNTVHFVRGIYNKFFHGRKFFSALFPCKVTRDLPYKLAKTVHDCMHDCSSSFFAPSSLSCTRYSTRSNTEPPNGVVQTHDSSVHVIYKKFCYITITNNVLNINLV